MREEEGATPPFFSRVFVVLASLLAVLKVKGGSVFR